MTTRLTLLLSLTLLSACREPNAPTAPTAPAAPTPAAASESAPAAPAAVADAGYPDGTAFAASTLCNVEFLGDVAFGAEPLPLNGPAVLRGWLGDEQGGAPTKVALRLVDEADAAQATLPVQLGESRADVVAAFPDRTGLANSGFALTLSPESLPAGTWRIHLAYTVGEGPGARAMTCDNGRRVVVAAAP